jgi:hypothetical protein
MNAQLRALGLQIQEQNGRLAVQRLDLAAEDRRRREVQGLGTALERANLPEADSVLRGVEDALKKTPQLAEYVSGPLAATPDLAVGILSPGMSKQQADDIRAGRQAFQKLFNITLKDRSGAAVTIPEFQRLKKEFATGVWKTPDQIRAGVEQARKVISDHYRGVAASFGPETLERYNENLRATGGTPLLEPRTAASPRDVKVIDFGSLK